jgi:long-chain acyl-CoA synthetase
LVPYYQQEKYTSIPDALVTKQNGEWIKTSTQKKEYIANANAIALIKLGVQKMIKLLSYPLIIELNGM